MTDKILINNVMTICKDIGVDCIYDNERDMVNYRNAIPFVFKKKTAKGTVYIKYIFTKELLKDDKAMKEYLPLMIKYQTKQIIKTAKSK